MGRNPLGKNVLVHLGPHKTGSTAIQKSLANYAKVLEQAQVCFFHTQEMHAAAVELANENFDSAEEQICRLSTAISDLKADTVILSQEDFCGPFIGRSAKRNIYPKLTKNLRILSRALRPHRVTFVFFVRSEKEWLLSSYHQHLKYRTRFYRFQDFAEFYEHAFSWDAKLAKPREAFGESFVTIPYKEDAFWGIQNLLATVPAASFNPLELPPPQIANVSPSAVHIRYLERINELSEFKETAWFSKSVLLKNQTLSSGKNKTPDLPDWPPKPTKTQICSLPKLRERSKMRVSKQLIEDILPGIDTDIEPLLHQRLPKNIDMPQVHRADIHNQSLILNYHLRGKSALNHLNALCISYLRRDTEHTAKARTLFHRIWREHGVVLVNELSTRWLLSTLQTFLDHGENEAQRTIGATGFFYGNMIKIYEGERAIEGNTADAVYIGVQAQTQNQFQGLDRYQVGGTDMMLNTNALALEIAQRDPVAGFVLQEFLLRVKSAETVFSRHDRTRKIFGINNIEFQNVWAFYEPWEE
ncbi:MAG: hypothetical protein ABJL72_04660 [Roseobacter sp.]